MSVKLASGLFNPEVEYLLTPIRDGKIALLRVRKRENKAPLPMMLGILTPQQLRAVHAAIGLWLEENGDAAETFKQQEG